MEISLNLVFWVLDIPLSRSKRERDEKNDFWKAMITEPTQGDFRERASIPGVTMHGSGKRVHHLIKLLPS